MENPPHNIVTEGNQLEQNLFKRETAHTEGFLKVCFDEHEWKHKQWNTKNVVKSP